MMTPYAARPLKEFPELPCPLLRKAQAACSRMNKLAPLSLEFVHAGANMVLWIQPRQVIVRSPQVILSTGGMYTTSTAPPATDQLHVIEVTLARLWMSRS